MTQHTLPMGVPQLQVVPATKRKTRSSTRRKPHTGPLPILTQIKLAWSHKLAFIIGLLFGTFVPVATWTIVHNEPWVPISLVMVAGGAVYSSLTVYGWGKIAWGGWQKAIGFVALIEGTMLFSQTFALSIAALGLLVFVNAVAAACRLSQDTKRG